MDILIKGMEMPKGNTPLVLIINSDGSVEEIDGSDEINVTDSTAIELPPHGALVDRDEELYQLATSMFPQDMDTTRVVARYKKWLKSAPVVLEANDE